MSGMGWARPGTSLPTSIFFHYSLSFLSILWIVVAHFKFKVTIIVQYMICLLEILSDNCESVCVFN